MNTRPKIFASLYLLLALVFGGAIGHFVMPTQAHAAGISIGCNEEFDTDASGHFVKFKNPCGFDDLILQIDKFIDFLLKKIALPLAAIAFAWAGFLFMTSGGNSGQIERAKGIFKKVLIGFVLALAAWLIVKAIMLGLGFNTDTFQSFFN